MQITPQMVEEHGLTPQEYQLVLERLGREPSLTELGIISVMWSEHASYKNSIKYLKKLPREGSALLTKTGEENAGVVDIGEGLAISFKIESHNHPSALEPYHGAATGVGGILRDIFTMGARPIAALNSLRFGNPNNPQVQHLIKGVVEGIADYGNCFGVPTVGGEVYFEDAYEGNPLVNAMAVGLMRHEHLATSAANGVGNWVVYVGAKTGRDGIHGATFASTDLSAASEEKRTAVQVGDPFLEKLLLEATLEVIQAGLVEGIQDMGAAGLTCSSSEMSAKAGNGMKIDLNKVPVREQGMTAYEIMLSESQERMLLVVTPQNFAAVEEIFHKWDLDAAVIGTVTDDGLLKVIYNGQQEAELPAQMLVLGGEAPVYDRETKKPDYLEQVWNFDPYTLPCPDDLNATLLSLMGCANIASKKAVYSQYDHMVQIGTMLEPGADAAVVRIPNTKKAIAVATDCNGRHVYLEPYEGGKAAVAEAARNVVCTGARPAAITNCLNFGNPYKPEVYWTFVEALAGMGDACTMFDTPVTGGNVSFYNENPHGAVYPTPTIGMLGIMDDYDRMTTPWFKQEGDLVLLLGKNTNELGGSEYLKMAHDTISGRPPQIDLEKERNLHGAVLQIIQKGLAQSAHDCADGGLSVALAECCFGPKNINLGAKINIETDLRADALLFGEAASRIIISIKPVDLETVNWICEHFNVPVNVIGKVQGQSLTVNNLINLPVEQLRNVYQNGLTL